MSQRESALEYSNAQYRMKNNSMLARETATERAEQSASPFAAPVQARRILLQSKEFPEFIYRYAGQSPGKSSIGMENIDDNGQVKTKRIYIAADYGQPVRVVFDGEVQLTTMFAGTVKPSSSNTALMQRFMLT